MHNYFLGCHYLAVRQNRVGIKRSNTLMVSCLMNHWRSRGVRRKLERKLVNLRRVELS